MKFRIALYDFLKLSLQGYLRQYLDLGRPFMDYMDELDPAKHKTLVLYIF